MAFKLTKRERDLLESLSGGLSEREAGLRLKLSDSALSATWQDIAAKCAAALPTTIAEYEVLAAYHRVECSRLEAELWASEARLNALMDASPDAVLVIQGRSGRILKVNNQALVLLGYSPRELINQPMEMLVEPDLRSKHVGLRYGFLLNIRKREMGYHPAIVALCKDGSHLELDIALTATTSTDDVMVVCRLPQSSPNPTTTLPNGHPEPR